MVTCPKCKKCAKFCGVGKQSKTGLYHEVYSCNGCSATFIKNPGSAKIQALANKPSYKRAIKLYESFNMKPADRVYMQSLTLPSEKNPLVYLGQIAGLIYISDKEKKRGQQYIHECENKDGKGYPNFFVTADGKTFIISGGSLQIKDGWLYF